MKTPEEIIQYKKDYYIRNRDKILAQKKLRSLAIKEYMKGYREKNAEIIKVKTKTYSDNNKEKIRERAFKSNYGITICEYDGLLISQNGLCAICFQPEITISKFTGKPKRLYVDHDHKTGKVRGLLCRPCNTGLGFYKDSIEIHKSAVEYLEAM